MSKSTTKHKSRRLRRFLRANEAVSALEYAILVGIVAVAIGAGIGLLGGDIQKAITKIGNKVDDIDGTAINTAVTP